jgi:hypothetical protein
MDKQPQRAAGTDQPVVGSLSERLLRRIFGVRYEANANDDAEMAVAHLIQQRDALAHALRHWDDAAREAGLTYDAVRDIMTDVQVGKISFSRGVELLRSLARVAAEQMAKDANNNLKVGG